MHFKITTNVDQVRKALRDFQTRVIPKMMAEAVNDIAVEVAKEETRNLAKVFPTVTPFMLGSIGLRRASPGHPVAYVFVKPVAANVLRPFEFGGKHFLGSKKALLAPRTVRLDRYGNVPRGTLKKFKGRKDTFVGEVNGVSGVWQRLPMGKSGRLPKGHGNVRPGQRLKLIIAFEEPKAVRQQLHYFDTAKRVVAQHAARAFGAAFDRAMKAMR